MLLRVPQFLRGHHRDHQLASPGLKIRPDHGFRLFLHLLCGKHGLSQLDVLNHARGQPVIHGRHGQKQGRQPLPVRPVRRAVSVGQGPARPAAVRRGPRVLPEAHVMVVVDEHRQPGVQAIFFGFPGDHPAQIFVKPPRHPVRFRVVIAEFRRVQKRLQKRLLPGKIRFERLFQAGKGNDAVLEYRPV